MSDTHYADYHDHHLKRFDRVFRVVTQELEKGHDPEWVKRVIAIVREGFEDLLPRLP